MFALIDASNFYISCERVFRPSLRGRPVSSLRASASVMAGSSDFLACSGIGSRVQNCCSPFPWFPFFC